MKEGRKYDNLGRGLQSENELEPRRGGLLAVADVGAVCCAAAILLSVTFPLFSFGTHPLPPPVYMDCQELTPLLTPRRAVTL